MPQQLASPEWIDAVFAALRSNRQVQEAGGSWVHGPLAIVINPAPDAGLEGQVSLRLDLHEGESRDLAAIDEGSLRRVPTVIAGPYARWKQLLGGTGSIVDGILQSHLQMRGDLPTVVRHRKLLDAMLEAMRGVATTFPDDAPVETPATAGSR